MKHLFYQWVSPHYYPPRWMAFTYYSAERGKALFVLPPVNFLIAFAWWLQDQWAQRAQRTSWIEEEVRGRIEQRRRSEYR